MHSKKSTVSEWPFQQTVFLTVDFECDFGTALHTNRYEAIEHVNELVSLLEWLNIPLTCFVQTEILTKHPETIETLCNAAVPISFHPHSHSHKPRNKTSVEREIEKSTRKYCNFFNDDPVGYRFPNGNVRDRDYEKLADYGYQFDASVFPSWRPGYFNNAFVETTPSYKEPYDIFELPFTVYSESIRIPTALSYCQVIGRPYIYLLKKYPPSTIVLNIHMHDLVRPSTISELPTHYKKLYSRNADGKSILTDILLSLSRQKYKFKTLDEAHSSLREA